MKKSKSGILGRFVKSKDLLIVAGVGGAAVMLNGCSEEAETYSGLEDCQQNNMDCPEQCYSAYQQAEEDALASGPSYRSQSDCESDFGSLFCEESDAGKFRARMAGFAMQCDDDYFDFDDDDDIDVFKKRKKYKKRHKSFPLYTSFKSNSPMKNQWVGLKGRPFGSYGSSRVSVNSDTDFKRPKSSSRTVSRGGFGRTVSHNIARSSSYSSSSRSGGWGG
jgi:uncharacterized protein YgiB involved in biofilm formation